MSFFPALLLLTLAAASPQRQEGVPSPERTGPTNAMQRLLDRQAAATTSRIVGWAGDAVRQDNAVASDLLDKAGSLGSGEGDLDQQILALTPAEPGITRMIADYDGRPRVATAYAIGQTSDHRLWIAGQIGEPSGALPTRIGIIQFEPNGAVDASFNISAAGRQYIDVSNPQLWVVAGIGLADEQLGTTFAHRIYLLAEDRSNPSQYNFALLCFRRGVGAPTTAFSPCPGFTPGGVRYYNANLASGCPTNHSRPGAIALGFDDAGLPVLYLGGRAQRTFNGCGDYDMAVLKVNMEGDPRTAFGTAGTGWTTRYVAHQDGDPPFVGMVLSLAGLPADLGVLFGGWVRNASGTTHAILGRFDGSGASPASFCAIGDSSCNSPSAYRAGVRGFSILLHGEVAAIGTLSLAAGGRFAVLRARTVTSHAARVSQVNLAGGCAVPLACNEIVIAPASGDAPFYPAAILPRRAPSGGIDPTAFVLAGWGLVADPLTPVDGKAVVIAVRDDGAGSLQFDPGYASTPMAGHRNVITWPNQSGPAAIRDARIHAARLDRQGRVLLAGRSRAVDTAGGEYDMSLARLQGPKRTFADGFESP